MHHDEPARVTRRLLDGADRGFGDDQRRHLALGDCLAGLHGLAVEDSEERDALERGRVRQRATADFKEAASVCRKRPLPAAVAFDPDAFADGRRAEPAPPLLLVEVAGLQREEVDLLPGRREQRLGGLRREAHALRDGDLARLVTHVVAQHAVEQALERRRLPSLRDGLHSRPGFMESGWPLPPPRTAWISATIASAISGADRAPRSSPIGTRMRLSSASLTPSSVRNLRIAPPRRDEPSMPM